MNNTILIIEDDESIIEMLTKYLRKEGFVIDSSLNGKQGIEKFHSRSFDLILLDLMMPELDGMEVIKEIRKTSSVPVLMMSAKDSDIDKALGLGFGADDYITKPFSMIEMLARIKASIRRATAYSHVNESMKNRLTFEELEIDCENFIVTKHGHTLSLTSTEFEILKLFATNPNRSFTKEQIYHSVWKEEYYSYDNVINVHMRRLREKIEDDPSSPKFIQTLWGIGYKWGISKK